MLLISFAFIAFILEVTNGHGRFMKPPNRSSVWRDPKFQSYNPLPNYDDNQLFCGGKKQATIPGSSCGVCGDPITERSPRSNEIGGKYFKNIITGRYLSGQVIDVEVEITAAHMGFMEWRLCTNPKTENQECFNQHLLQRADGSGSQVPVKSVGMYRTKIQLPSGVRCDHCIIQWNYRAGNDWGQNPPQETFRGCSDISIQ